ncbi:MAG TPA: lytic transglycosylase domain-containing protein [Kiritimatiellia bacterium]|nr:lytic transglycosylase domain-containing protein [Kiritimatiellia bacterium]
MALLISAASGVRAQEFQFEAVLQKGLDLVDRQLDAHGYELDREALSAIPRAEDVARFFGGIDQVLENGSIEEIAWLKPEVVATLAWLEQWPAAAPYANWLRQQVDYFDVAEESVAREPDAPHRPPPAPTEKAVPLKLPPPPKPAPPPARQKAEKSAQSPETWKKKMANRPPPARAAELAPQIKSIFRAEGLPEELIWLAEVESSFDPRARSPVGAVGLFQFMPATAKRFGLNPERPDERQEPEKSARAAAAYLRFLHGRFGSWPLALAGYNAGEGRVGRTLREQKATTFEQIADVLPLETRMYVPKIAAVIEHREGVQLASLPPPR